MLPCTRLKRQKNSPNGQSLPSSLRALQLCFRFLFVSFSFSCLLFFFATLKGFVHWLSTPPPPQQLIFGAADRSFWGPFSPPVELSTLWGSLLHPLLGSIFSRLDIFLFSKIHLVCWTSPPPPFRWKRLVDAFRAPPAVCVFTFYDWPGRFCTRPNIFPPLWFKHLTNTCISFSLSGNETSPTYLVPPIYLIWQAIAMSPPQNNAVPPYFFSLEASLCHQVNC